jgi:hypothetical protein
MLSLHNHRLTDRRIFRLMALGPFARVFAQFVVVAGGAVGRAMMNAYKEAAQRGAQQGASTLSQVISRRMSVDEATKILEVDVKSVTQEKVVERAGHLWNTNNPTAEFPGSPYIQKRVQNAQTVLIDHLQKLHSKP